MNKKCLLGVLLLAAILVTILVGCSPKSKIVSECISNETCQNIDCSSYDKPGIKEGYKPFCVDNQCKCMCYGCE